MSNKVSLYQRQSGVKSRGNDELPHKEWYPKGVTESSLTHKAGRGVTSLFLSLYGPQLPTSPTAHYAPAPAMDRRPHKRVARCVLSLPRPICPDRLVSSGHPFFPKMVISFCLLPIVSGKHRGSCISSSPLRRTHPYHLEPAIPILRMTESYL